MILLLLHMFYCFFVSERVTMTWYVCVWIKAGNQTATNSYAKIWMYMFHKVTVVYRWSLTYIRVWFHTSANKLNFSRVIQEVHTLTLILAADMRWHVAALNLVKLCVDFLPDMDLGAVRKLQGSREHGCTTFILHKRRTKPWFIWLGRRG
jgi:hypothetical protein